MQSRNSSAQPAMAAGQAIAVQCQMTSNSTFRSSRINGIEDLVGHSSAQLAPPIVKPKHTWQFRFVIAPRREDIHALDARVGKKYLDRDIS